MGWRDKYKVHPAADVFPMMSDEELKALGEDIKANGLKHPILVLKDSGAIIDGRNRLEAMERIGFIWSDPQLLYPMDDGDDPVSFIISVNIHRRHLTKQQQADLIVAAVKAGAKLDQVEPVSKGGRGKKSPVKEKAVAEAKKHDISEATVKRAIAKAELTPEEIEARRQKFEEQARNRYERTRAAREEKVERKAKRASDVAEALAILDIFPIEVADRLVTLLMDGGTVADVSLALNDLMNERDEARSELDDLLEDAVDDPTSSSAAALVAELETELKKKRGAAQ
jgi:hypothetical protein